MKKKIIQAGYIAAFLLVGGYAQAQVKVGDNPTAINANSALEIESSNKGLLIPRIALTGATSASPLSAHVAGMTVYNTATAGTAPNNVTPGFYYNDGTRWVAVKDNYLTSEVDGVIGNEVTDVNSGKGLTRTGAGTAADPYKVGMTDGTASGQVMQWNGTAWTLVDGVSLVPDATTLVNGKVRLAGDLAGTGTTAAAPRVSGLQGHPVSATAPTNGQILVFNGTSWVPTAPSAASEMDGIIGNEILDVVANKGLTRSGAGTDTDPYKVGMTDGTAAGQVMKWNGTAWTPAADAGLTSEVDGSVTNEIQTLSISGSDISLSLGGGSVTLPAEVDGVIGNEVTNATANMGLIRSGAGTTASPYTVGMIPGTAAGQVMQWNGTSWSLSSAGSGTVTSVTGTAPINVVNGTTTPVISLNNLGVQNIHLAADAVTSDKILDGTILNADLANGVGGIYKGSGSLAGATTVTGGANTLAFTSTATNGFSVDGNTFSVDAANNRVGIGTSLPTAPLHVSSSSTGAIRIQDGTQGNGKVLMSDVNGVGSWASIGASSFLVGSFTPPHNVLQPASTATDRWRELGYIDLEPGTWSLSYSVRGVQPTSDTGNNAFHIMVTTVNNTSITNGADIMDLRSIMLVNAGGANTFYGDIQSSSIFLNNSTAGIVRYYIRIFSSKDWMIQDLSVTYGYVGSSLIIKAYRI